MQTTDKDRLCFTINGKSKKTATF